MNLSRQGAPLTFSFAWMTHNKRYSLQEAKKFKGNAAPILESLFELLVTLSQENWNDLDHLSKYQGGYEQLPVSELKDSILDAVPEETVRSTIALDVFRFGKEKARLIALSTPDKPDLLYIVGFDLDFSLYHHGS